MSPFRSRTLPEENHRIVSLERDDGVQIPRILIDKYIQIASKGHGPGISAREQLEEGQQEKSVF